MDAITALGGIGAAFGFSTSAGLNAYIPMLIVALAARFPADDPFLSLAEPYDLLSHWLVIGVLVILLLVEMFVDKIPVADTINDVIQTFIRPAAGAILFAASADVITDLSPIIALLAGLVLAGGVHATKGAVRPVVTATTAGTGNWLVSIVEDVVATFVSLLSVLIPILGLVAVGLFLILLVVFFRRRRRKDGLAYR